MENLRKWGGTVKGKKDQQKADYGNLNKTQEVLYGREFKRADQAYNPSNNAKP